MHVAICLVILGAYTNIIFIIKMQILALIKQSPLWSSLSEIPDTVYVSQRPQVTSQDDWDVLCKEEYLLESSDRTAQTPSPVDRLKVPSWWSFECVILCTIIDFMWNIPYVHPTHNVRITLLKLTCYVMFKDCQMLQHNPQGRMTATVIFSSNHNLSIICQAISV